MRTKRVGAVLEDVRGLCAGMWRCALLGGYDGRDARPTSIDQDGQDARPTAVFIFGGVKITQHRLPAFDCFHGDEAFADRFTIGVVLREADSELAHQVTGFVLAVDGD